MVAIVFSLMVGFLFWKRFSKQSVVFDLVCLVTILFILGVDMYLGVTLNLKAPYTSAVKYIYQSLPFFSLVAGSLASKSGELLKYSRKLGRAADRLKGGLLLSVSLVGLFLLLAPIFANMNTALQLTTVSHVIFRVHPEQDIGYTFLIPLPSSEEISMPALVQFHGFIILVSGLLWASRHFILDSIQSLHHRIRAKNALHIQQVHST